MDFEEHLMLFAPCSRVVPFLADLRYYLHISDVKETYKWKLSTSLFKSPPPSNPADQKTEIHDREGTPSS